MMNSSRKAMAIAVGVLMIATAGCARGSSGVSASARSGSEATPSSVDRVTARADHRDDSAEASGGRGDGQGTTRRADGNLSLESIGTSSGDHGITSVIAPFADRSRQDQVPGVSRPALSTPLRVPAAASPGDELVICGVDVSLRNGHFLDLSTDVPPVPPFIAQGYSANVFPVTGPYNCDSKLVYLPKGATVAYQFAMLGKPTDFWVRVSRDSEGDLSCKVVVGNLGVTVDNDETYFACNIVASPGFFPVLQVGLHISDILHGSVGTSGNVSLADGYWEAIQPFQFNGASTVGINSSTTFRTIQRYEEPVLTPNEDPTKSINVDNDAVMLLAYRIVDNGTSTDYWIRGYTTTQDEGKSICDVYYGNPIPSGGAVLKAEKQTVSPYQCTVSGKDDGDDDVPVSFVVSRRQMTVIPAGSAQENQRTELMSYCSTHMNDCSFVLSEAHRVNGELVERASDIYQNNTSSPMSVSLTATHETRITNTFGITYEESLSFLGIAETKVTYKYEFSITDVESISKTQTMTIAPGRIGWWGMVPIMIHVEGSVLVQRNGTLYLLPDISADYPDGTGDASLVAQEA